MIVFTLRELIIAELIFADGGSQKGKLCGIYFCGFHVRKKTLKTLLNLLLRTGDNQKYKMFSTFIIFIST